jgi:hypothetical protein
VKSLPADPMGQHARFMAAFCDDLLAGDYTAPRAKAVCEISRQVNQRRARHGNVSGVE